MNHSFYVKISFSGINTIKDGRKKTKNTKAERERNRKKELNTHFLLYIIYIHTYIHIYNHNIDRSDYIEDNLLNESKCHDDNKKGAIRIFLVYTLFP